MSEASVRLQSTSDDPVMRARLLENEGRLEEAMQVLAALPEGPRSSADASYRRLLQIYAAARRSKSDECGNETQLGEHHAV